MLAAYPCLSPRSWNMAATVSVTELIKHVIDGDVDTVARMLRQRPELVELDSAGNDERRALHHAVMGRDVEMVTVLMRAGTDARKGVWPFRDATDAHTLARDRGFDDVVAAIEAEEQRRRKAMSGPSSNVTPVQEQINQAIRRAENPEATRLLEADESRLRACDLEGGSPLHAAAEAANEDMLVWLLQRGADPHKTDSHGLTPLDRAAVAVDPRNNRAARFPRIAQLLVAHGAEKTIRASVAMGDTARVRALAQVEPERLGAGIHWWKGGLLSVAVKHRQPELVRVLLDLGADVDERTHRQATEEDAPSWGMPLWFAALDGQYDTAELLLDHGADPNANVYASGWALGNAYARRDERLKQLLCDRGAKPHAHTIAAVHDVAGAKRMLASTDGDLQAVAQELTWSAADAGCPAIVELALPYLEWHRSDPQWQWVLIQPIRGWHEQTNTAGSLDCMRLLVEHGIDVSVSSRLGQTVLHFLAARDCGEHDESDRVRFGEMLLDAGGRLDAREKLLLSTPLGWACRWGRQELVGLFLDRGASAQEPDAEPWATPLAWATRRGHDTVAALLRDRLP